MHCEPTWNATPRPCDRPCRAQERNSGFDIRAKFRRQIDCRAGFRKREANEQAGLGVACAVAGCEFVEDFVQLSLRIEHKIAHVVHHPRFADRGAGFHRVHEMDFAPGNMRRTSETSEIDAQSKCRTPPSHTARSTAGSGLHFTA